MENFTRSRRRTILIHPCCCSSPARGQTPAPAPLPWHKHLLTVADSTCSSPALVLLAKKKPTPSPLGHSTPARSPATRPPSLQRPRRWPSPSPPSSTAARPLSHVPPTSFPCSHARTRAWAVPEAPVASKDRADVATNLRRLLLGSSNRAAISGLILQGARRGRGLPGFGVGPPRLGAR